MWRLVLLVVLCGCASTRGAVAGAEWRGRCEVEAEVLGTAADRARFVGECVGWAQ